MHKCRQRQVEKMLLHFRHFRHPWRSDAGSDRGTLLCQAKEVMHNNYSTPSQTCADPAGKRAFQRYSLDLPAFIRVAGGAHLSCVIRNFCIGGMLLSYQKPTSLAAATQGHLPAAGDIITIHCIVQATNQDNRLQFQARVVRTFEDGAGMAFINPDLTALQIMQDFAIQPAIGMSSGGSIARGSSPGDEKTSHVSMNVTGDMTDNMKGDTIMKECNRVIESALDGISQSVNSKMPNRMFELSRDTKNHKEQNSYFNARDVLNRSAVTLTDLFRVAVHKRLANIAPKQLRAQSKATSDKNGVPMSELSLVEDDALTDWLSISDINYNVESTHKKLLFAIEQRLSMVCNVPIGKDNNPYGPGLFVESFLSAIKPLGLDPVANTACLAVFKDVLVEKTNDLYQKLNAVLVDFGVLPDLKSRVLRENTAPPRDVAPSPHVPPNITGNAGPGGRNLYQVSHEIRRLRDGVAHQVSRPTETVFAPHTDVQVLREAGCRERPPHTDVQMPYREPPPSTQPPGQVYAVSDVISALASLQADYSDQIAGNNAPRNIKSLVRAVLERANPGSADKEISAHDSSVMEVAGDLFHAIQDDPLVAESVRPWLKRLELPILKLTLADNTVFLDRAHVARQVLNKIAQLEIHDNEQTGSSQSPIKNTIDRLIDRINKEFDGTSEVFSKILVQLDKLTQAQDKAYAENVKDVVTVCEKVPVVAEWGDEPESAEDPADVIWKKWLKQARRLKEGDWMLFLTHEEKAQRLRVAWVSKSTSGVYVFVNSRGLKEKVLGAKDLARKMRLGNAIPLDNADDLAMDRAQYTALQELHKQLLYETTHDQVTGLISRREFESMLGKAVVSAQQIGLRHVLCLVDVDKFSAVNNSCGSVGGDTLLKELAALLKKTLSGRGVLARLGSDEFGMLVENASPDDARAIAEQQINAVAGYRFEWEDKRFSVSLSMGLVPVDTHGNNITELLQAAQSSCNLAKVAGGNRLQVYHADNFQLVQHSAVMKWVGKIDRILEEDRLLLFCQRIVPINGDTSVQPHFEILLRVAEDQKNIISPHEFIQAAEWYGRMAAVDRWVITKVFKWMADHREALEDITAFTINLSGQSITDDSFIGFVLEQMNNTQIPQHKICFEVTETAGITNLSDAAAFITEIKKTGCMFALDDFGSGMSSYAYLKNLPVDFIKIDGVFVRNMEVNSIDYALVKSICEVGHFMNKKVVAEYVENDKILNLLCEIGVDYAQGYAIDKPCPLDRLLSLKQRA